MPPSNASSSSAALIENDLSWPRTSVNQSRMKELEARGIVERQVREGSPARVEYSLTEMGRELAPSLRELREWALRWL